MKKKHIYGVIVSALVLILALGVLAACNDGDVAERPAKYTVNFIDGETTVKSVEFNAVQRLKDTDFPSAPEHEGKQFVGWFLEDGVTEVKERFIVDQKELNVYAKYEDAICTIEFVDASSGSDATVKSMTVAYGYELVAADIPDAPEHEDKQFVGWLLEDGETKVEVGFKATTSVKAYAKYAGVYVEDGFRYVEKADGSYVVSVTGTNYAYPASVSIKAQVNGKAVTEIGDMTKLTTNAITVPASVTKIADGAFKGNNYVYEADLSAFGGSIGAEAFMDGKLRYIDLGATKEIGADAFNNSALALIYVPASVEDIGGGAFDSQSLIEVGFVGAFPTVHGSVFGSGERPDDSVSIVASVTAWEALTGCGVNDANFTGSVKAKLNVEQASIFTWSDEMITDAVAYHGRYVGEDIKVYLGMGINAVLDKDGAATVTSVFDGEEPSDHIYDYVSSLDTSNRDTYYLDKATKTAQLLEANAAGEVIKGDYLYDYKGKALRYIVSSAVTKIAGGAGQLNPNVRFLEIGDNITSVGSFAFSSGQLFGITIGSNVTSIGEFAFFDQNSLQQLLFTAEEDAPEIGQGAFTVLVNGAFAPVTYNQLAQYGMDVKIYLVNNIKHYDWDLGYVYDEGAAFKDALDQALAGLPVVKVGNIGDAEEDFKDAKYEDNSFTTFTTSYFAGKGKQYICRLGTITMSGTTNGYAYIDFADGGLGYIYFSHIPGYNLSYYDDQSVPLKIQVFTEMIGGKMQSEVIYGYFKDTALVLRGAEAGIYGDIDKEYVIIDGYDKIEYHKQDGAIVNGTYTAASNVLTVSGIDGVAEITVDLVKHDLTFGDKTLTALGEEAGVYYDLFHAAMVKLDGKAFESEVDDSSVKYSGTLYYTVDGATVSAPYIIDGKKIIFTLDDELKSWTFDKQAQKIEGDYDEDYNSYNFLSMSIGTHGTFDNGDSHLELDGFYTATIDGESYSYYLFGTSVVVFMPQGDTIYNLDFEGHTYSVPAAAEAGAYYVTTSKNYRLYLDGKGTLLYNNGSYNIGEYAYDAATKQFDMKLGENEYATEKGSLDADKGVGAVVFSEWGNTYMGVSKQPLTQVLSYRSVKVYIVSGDDVSSDSASLNAYVSGNSLFITTYGVAVGIYDFIGSEQSFEFKYKSAAITIDVSKDGDSYTFVATFKPYATETITATVDGAEKGIVLCWLDEEKTMLGIYENESKSNIVCGKVVWNQQHDGFTIESAPDEYSSGEITSYTVSGYGTDSVTLTKNQ